MSDPMPSEGLIITVLAMFGGCLAGAAACILKSRCTRIKCCGCECDRDVIANPTIPDIAGETAPQL